MLTDLKNNRFQKKLMMQDTIYEYLPLQLSTLGLHECKITVEKYAKHAARNVQRQNKEYLIITDIFRFLAWYYGVFSLPKLLVHY